MANLTNGAGTTFLGIRKNSGSLGALHIGKKGGTQYEVLTGSDDAAGAILANVASGTITHFTASYAKITNLDVNTINSITETVNTLEVSDKLIIAGS